jgi:hypothetical protein
MYNTRPTDIPPPSYYEPNDSYNPDVEFSFTRTVKHTRIPHKCTACQHTIPPNSATTTTFERVEGTTYQLRTCTGINSPLAYNCNIIAGPIGRTGYLVIGDDSVAYFPQVYTSHATWHAATLATLTYDPNLVPISYENRRIYG